MNPKSVLDRVLISSIPVMDRGNTFIQKKAPKFFVRSSQTQSYRHSYNNHKPIPYYGFLRHPVDYRDYLSHVPIYSSPCLPGIPSTSIPVLSVRAGNWVCANDTNTEVALHISPRKGLISYKMRLRKASIAHFVTYIDIQLRSIIYASVSYTPDAQHHNQVHEGDIQDEDDHRDHNQQNNNPSLYPSSSSINTIDNSTNKGRDYNIQDSLLTPGYGDNKQGFGEGIVSLTLILAIPPLFRLGVMCHQRESSISQPDFTMSDRASIVAKHTIQFFRRRDLEELLQILEHHSGIYSLFLRSNYARLIPPCPQLCPHQPPDSIPLAAAEAYSVLIPSAIIVDVVSTGVSCHPVPVRNIASSNQDGQQINMNINPLNKQEQLKNKNMDIDYEGDELKSQSEEDNDYQKKLITDNQNEHLMNKDGNDDQNTSKRCSNILFSIQPSVSFTIYEQQFFAYHIYVPPEASLVTLLMPLLNPPTPIPEGAAQLYITAPFPEQLHHYPDCDANSLICPRTTYWIEEPPIQRHRGKIWNAAQKLRMQIQQGFELKKSVSTNSRKLVGELRRMDNLFSDLYEFKFVEADLVNKGIQKRKQRSLLPQNSPSTPNTISLDRRDDSNIFADSFMKLSLGLRDASCLLDSSNGECLTVQSLVARNHSNADHSHRFASINVKAAIFNIMSPNDALIRLENFRQKSKREAIKQLFQQKKLDNGISPFDINDSIMPIEQMIEQLSESDREELEIMIDGKYLEHTEMLPETSASRNFEKSVFCCCSMNQQSISDRNGGQSCSDLKREDDNTQSLYQKQDLSEDSIHDSPYSTITCPCLLSGEPCSPACACSCCGNPLNVIASKAISECAKGNLLSYLRALRFGNLSDVVALTCKNPIRIPIGGPGTPMHTINKLPHTALRGDLCAYDFKCRCQEPSFYSFCKNQVVSRVNQWHCIECNRCRDISVVHCKRCNNCSRETELPCEFCSHRNVLENWRLVMNSVGTRKTSTSSQAVQNFPSKPVVSKQERNDIERWDRIILIADCTLTSGRQGIMLRKKAHGQNTNNIVQQDLFWMHGEQIVAMELRRGFRELELNGF
ncbi:MAG: hypothetical protein EZS28_004763 [Streblomastix strix]|uniref:Uncharacterized protein n=1 Tax=Streblomastix strix TaxID=222440 RepID=A0A5J4WXY6_9EUKA|nr:MAG: hypothetical protein EZS28_004763 [Streblomastix strix]